jgi:hypothetical protein
MLSSMNCTVGVSIVTGCGEYVNAAIGLLYTVTMLSLVNVELHPLSDTTVSVTLYAPLFV